MQIQKVIEQLGYTANEAKVYLATLALGEAHISDIAAKAKLPRSSAQVIVDKLHKDGLLNFYVMRRYKYWVAESPERLLTGLRRREEDMRQALPTLTALKNAGGHTAKKGGRDASLGLFQMLADALPHPVLIADEHAEIQYVNAPWEQQFGYLLKEIRGENPRILQSGKTPRAVHERMWKALKAEKIFQTDEIIDKRKDGTFFNMLTTITAARHNGTLFYIQILNDVTEEKRAKALASSFLRSTVER